MKTLYPVFLPAAPNCLAESPTKFLRKFSQKKFFFAQFCNWTPNVEVFTRVPNFYHKNPNKNVEPISQKENSSLIKFCLLCRMGFWQTCRKELAKFPKKFRSVSQKKCSIKLLFSAKKKQFSSKVPLEK